MTPAAGLLPPQPGLVSGPPALCPQVPGSFWSPRRRCLSQLPGGPGHPGPSAEDAPACRLPGSPVDPLPAWPGRVQPGARSAPRAAGTGRVAGGTQPRPAFELREGRRCRAASVQASAKPARLRAAHPGGRACMRVRGACSACCPRSWGGGAAVGFAAGRWCAVRPRAGRRAAPSSLRFPGRVAAPPLARGHSQEGFDPGGETAERPPEGARRGERGLGVPRACTSARPEPRAPRVPGGSPAAAAPPPRRAARASPAPPWRRRPGAAQLGWALSRRDAGGAGRAAPPGENNEAALRTGAGRVAGLEPHQSRGAAAPGATAERRGLSHTPRERVWRHVRRRSARVQGCRLRGSSAPPAGPTVRRPGSRRRLRAWAPGPRFPLPSLPCAPRGSVAAGPRLGRWVGASGAAGGEPPAPRLCPHGAPAFLRICPALPGIKRWRLNSLCIRGSWAPSSCPTPRVQHTPQHRHFLQEMETLGSAVKVHPWEEGADRGQWLL